MALIGFQEGGDVAEDTRGNGAGTTPRIGRREQIRRLRDGLVRSVVLLVACIAVISVAAVLAMLRSPGHGGVILALAGVVDRAAIAAAAVINGRVWRRSAELADALREAHTSQH